MCLWDVTNKNYLLYSSKLKKMSKVGSGGRRTVMKKTLNPSFEDGDGSFFTSTESFLNDTDTFF